MQIPSGGQKFEQPDAGMFVGTIIDVVFLKQVPSKNPKFPESKDRLRIIWVLDTNGADGKPFRIMEQPPFRMANGNNNTKKSRLFEIFDGVFAGQIPVPYESEDLIGRSNLLFLVKDGEYTNIKGFLPVPAGKTPPTAPAGFVRDKDKAKTATAGVVTASTTQAQTAAVAEEEADIAF
jgi:hypothetical protein